MGLLEVYTGHSEVHMGYFKVHVGHLGVHRYHLVFIWATQGSKWAALGFI